MATLLRVPEVAAGATEVVLSEWLVDEGSEVESGAPVVVVETEKAVVEVEAEAGGTVLRRLAEASSSVEVGSPLMLVGSSSESGDIDALLADLGVTSAPARPAPERRDVEETETSTTPAPERDPGSGSPVPDEPKAESAATPEDRHQPAAPAAEQPQRDRIFATPLSRRLLAEAGISVESVTGTGPNGRITKKDAQQACADQGDPSTPQEPGSGTSESPPAARASADGATYTEVEHSRLRRAVASRLSTSKQTVPHFYLKRAVRIDALLQLRAQLNDVSPQRISVNDLVVRAVAVAHQVTPEANVIWTEDALRRFESVDIGVAIASERGLVTPVVRGVESTTPSGIARRIRELVEQAGTGKLHQRDLEGGTISVTNLGMYGVDEFSAIINPPQSAILAVGAGAPQPVVTDGIIEVATLMNLVLSVDHRAIDGAVAAQWMAELVAVIEEPMRLLT